jgi:hypothetical protein
MCHRASQRRNERIIGRYLKPRRSFLQAWADLISEGLSTPMSLFASTHNNERLTEAEHGAHLRAALPAWHRDHAGPGIGEFQDRNIVQWCRSGRTIVERVGHEVVDLYQATRRRPICTLRGNDPSRSLR